MVLVFKQEHGVGRFWPVGLGLSPVQQMTCNFIVFWWVFVVLLLLLFVWIAPKYCEIIQHLIEHHSGMTF